MANKITAINTYRPRVEAGNTVQKQELVRQLARATGLNEGSADLVIKELRPLRPLGTSPKYDESYSE